MTDNLDPNGILKAEFEYITKVVAQNNEGQTRIASSFWGTIASGIAVLVSLNLDIFSAETNPVTYLVFSVIFSLLTVYSFFTVLHLTRLRKAWIDCLLAMNKIKDTYAAHNAALPIKEAFRWNTSNVPRPFAWWSVSFVDALQVSLISGLAAGSAMTFYLYYLDTPNQAVAVITGTAMFFVQMLVYWGMLRK